jgi:hypothetical protein
MKFTIMNYDVHWGMEFNHVLANMFTITEICERSCVILSFADHWVSTCVFHTIRH